jgi:3-oxoadipate enol-lactonase
MSLSEIEIAYDDVGSGPAVVLLHGFPFDRSMWREQIAFLSAHGFRAIAPDLRGLGEVSDKLQFVAATDGEGQRQAKARRTTLTTMEEMARDVAALLDDLRIDSAVICGLSMGAYVTFEFAHLFPSRVSAMVLAGARAQGPDDAEKKSREEKAQQVLVEGMSGLAGGIVPQMLAAKTLVDKPGVVERVRRMIAGTNAAGAAAAQRGMAARRDYSLDLERIDVPTLIIAGREDAVRKPADAEFIHRGIKDSRLEIIDNAGHLMNMEQPEVFNGVLADFLGLIH